MPGVTEKDYCYMSGVTYHSHHPGYHSGGGGGGGQNMEMMPPPPPPPGGGQYANDHLIPATATIVVKGPKTKWSWCSSALAGIVLWLCCPLFGFLGLLCSMLSYTDHKVGDEPRSSTKKKCAWCWIITGLLIGLLMYALLVVYVYKYFHLFREMYLSSEVKGRENYYDKYNK